MKVIVIVCVAVLCVAATNAGAAEIYFYNGDRIKGEIVKESSKTVMLKTEAMGVVSIDKKHIKEVVDEKALEIAKAKEEKEKLWSTELAIGYDKTSGNTQKSQLSTKLLANRKTDRDEFTVLGNSFYSTTDKKMDSQKWYGMVRYAFSFGRTKKWYNFYRTEVDHDRFTNIDYRITPGAGLGYWFSDADDFKAMAEFGVGAQYTNYRDNTEDSTEAILVPRAFFEKKLFKNLTISEDITLYPSLEDTSNYRLHSEAALTNAINEHFSLRVSFIDDYNSSPPANTKKNDFRIISSLIHSF